MSFASPLVAREVSRPAKLGETPFFNAGRLQSLLQILEPFHPDGTVSTGDTRIDYEWNVRVAGTDSLYVPAGPINPFSIPDVYDDPEGSAELNDIVNTDFTTAVDLALKYKMLDDTVALESVIGLLEAWSGVTSIASNIGSVGNWNDKWPLMIQAAMMVNDSDLYTESLHDALVDATNMGLAVSLANVNTNNLGAWGVCYELAAAAFLGDRALQKRAIRRWRSLFDDAVVDNIPILEIYRDGGGYGDGSSGLWYSNFFMSALVIGAEWARFGGEWLYGYESREGSTLEGVVKQVRYWTRYPTEFPYNTSGTPSSTVRIMAHDEITHALWPDADSQWLLDNFPNGSVRDNFGMRQFVLAYRDRPLYG
jgi:hypothetical protein